jgi:NADH-quinone oxidoreductase subunit G
VRDGDRLVPPRGRTRCCAGGARAGRAGGARAVVSPFASNEDLGALRRLVDSLGGRRGRSSAWSRARRWCSRASRSSRCGRTAPPTCAAPSCSASARRRRGRRGGLERRRRTPGCWSCSATIWPTRRPTSGPRLALHLRRAGAGPAARNAHFVLPATTFAEMEGSFTNAKGGCSASGRRCRSRGWRAPRGRSWACCSRGDQGDVAPATPADAFASLGEIRAEFGEIRWEDLGAQGGRCRSWAPSPSRRATDSQQSQATTQTTPGSGVSHPSRPGRTSVFFFSFAFLASFARAMQGAAGGWNRPEAPR